MNREGPGCSPVSLSRVPLNCADWSLQVSTLGEQTMNSSPYASLVEIVWSWIPVLVRRYEINPVRLPNHDHLNDLDLFRLVACLQSSQQDARGVFTSEPDQDIECVRHSSLCCSPGFNTDMRNRCQRCRRKKIRCSGAAPCQGCTERSTPCIFDEVGKKIMVPERQVPRGPWRDKPLTLVKIFPAPCLYGISSRTASRCASRSSTFCGRASSFDSC
jgi:hypothetical protein